MKTIRAGLAMGLLLAGCARQEPAEQATKTETAEVAPAVDAKLSTAEDQQEVRRESGFSGVLPEDFPHELPLYRPSTLVDFGGNAAGRFVVLQTPDALAVVRARLPQLLRAQSWQNVSGAEWRHTGGRRVRIALEDARPGTRLRIDYGA